MLFRSIPHYYLSTQIDMSRAMAWLADENFDAQGRQRARPLWNPYLAGALLGPLQGWIIDRFGPHRVYNRETGFETSPDPDRLVKTHCCFCGMQCGIQDQIAAACGTTTAEEAVRFAREQGSPRFKVILDVRAMSLEARPVPDIIRACRGEFAYVHANDRNLKGPGFGEVDFRPIAAALREAGYDGTVSVEVFRFDEGPEVIASRSLEHLRKTFS